jgi:hypothetical protein
MKYLKVLLVVFVAVLTFGGAMAQQVVVQARVGTHYHHRHWHHRHYRHHDHYDQH